MDWLRCEMWGGETNSLLQSQEISLLLCSACQAPVFVFGINDAIIAIIQDRLSICDFFTLNSQSAISHKQCYFISSLSSAGIHLYVLASNSERISAGMPRALLFLSLQYFLDTQFDDLPPGSILLAF